MHWRCSLLLAGVNSGPRRVKTNQCRATGGWQGELHEATPEITSVYGAGLCRNLPAPGLVFLGETCASGGSAEMKAAFSWPLSSEAVGGGSPCPQRCRAGGGDEFPGMIFQLSPARTGAARGCLGPRPPEPGASAGAARGDKDRTGQRGCCALVRRTARKE